MPSTQAAPPGLVLPMIAGISSTPSLIGHRRQDDGENQVHDHAGRDNRHAGRDGLGRVAARIEEDRFSLGGLRRDRLLPDAGMRMRQCFDRLRTARWRGFRGFGFGVARVVVLAEHFHVAAQRQAADAVFRFAPLELEERPRNLPRRERNLELEEVEADVELFALHAAGLGDQKVAQLVHENHERQAGADAEPGQHLQIQPTGQARLLGHGSQNQANIHR